MREQIELKTLRFHVLNQLSEMAYTAFSFEAIAGGYRVHFQAAPTVAAKAVGELESQMGYSRFYCRVVDAQAGIADALLVRPTPADCDHPRAHSVAQSFFDGVQILKMYCPDCLAGYEQRRTLAWPPAPSAPSYGKGE